MQQHPHYHTAPSVLNQNSKSWVSFVKICFAASILSMAAGILLMPTELWVKAYFSMGTLMVVASSIMLSKTMRDEFESEKLHHRINEARTEQMLRDIPAA
jgi:hypothetical protein